MHDVLRIQREPVEALILDTDQAPRSLHRRLATFNHMRLTPRRDALDWEARIKGEYALRLLEGRFVEVERRQVRARAEQAPRDPDAFVSWFEGLEQNGPGQHDPLFEWLARDATREEMTWFLQQEMAGEAGFEDLLALTQIKLPTQVKLELARNYWDEMGQGHPSGMHGPMLERLGRELGIVADDNAVWESLALANLMVALAANRHYAYQSIGALGVIELTAPGRAVAVSDGLKRLGVSGEARRYFALHATLDLKHSATWNREVLRPLVAQEPSVATAIAEGALLRLQAGARCFDRYRRVLGVSSSSPAVAESRDLS
ncbi:MAG TPA: iron-containing redox enzyme family protein [Polyangiales bacterium]